MNIQQIKYQLNKLKLDVDYMQKTLLQTTDVIYAMEEILMDAEDKHIDLIMSKNCTQSYDMLKSICCAQEKGAALTKI